MFENVCELQIAFLSDGWLLKRRFRLWWSKLSIFSIYFLTRQRGLSEWCPDTGAAPAWHVGGFLILATRGLKAGGAQRFDRA